MDDLPPISVPGPLGCEQAQLEIAKRRRIAAGVLGIVLGYMGIHKFMLGYTTAGMIMLGISIAGAIGCCGSSFLLAVLPCCLCGWPIGALPTAMCIIGVVEGIIYLTKTDEEFCMTYIRSRRTWF